MKEKPKEECKHLHTRPGWDIYHPSVCEDCGEEL